MSEDRLVLTNHHYASEPPQGNVHHTLARRLARILLTAVLVAICFKPFLGRLKHPSLFQDDVHRIKLLQTSGAMLFHPINEHMAPFFQAVSWASWQLAAERLVYAPLTFTLASFVPFVLSLGLIGWVVRREVGSATTAWVAVAVFGLSRFQVETVYWYSASSFTWALVWTLTAWLGTILSLEGKSRLGWTVIVLASVLAPMCSAIGLLAGPLASLRVLAAVDRPWRRWIRAWALAPLGGTLAYLAICSLFRYHDVLADRVGQTIDLEGGLVGVGRAPIDVLLPGLLGLGPILDWLPQGLDLRLSGLGLIGVLLWAWYSPGRPLILGGLALILGGYGLIFCVRTYLGLYIYHAPRYHLFPHLGLTLLLAAGARPWLVRWDARPYRGQVVAVGVAALLLVAHQSRIHQVARAYCHSDQGRVLAALDHLGAICREKKITRSQAIAALDPIWTRWSAFPESNYNPLEMLPESVEVAGVPESQVRPTLLAALSPADRGALCGGLDPSSHLRPAGDFKEFEPMATGRLVGRNRVQEVREGEYVTQGGLAFLEYELPDAGSSMAARTPGTSYQTSRSGPEVQALCVPASPPENLTEIWWTDEGGQWSVERSLRWRSNPAQMDWAIPLDRLPHWNPAARRIRIVLRTPRQATIGTPRLLR